MVSVRDGQSRVPTERPHVVHLGRQIGDEMCRPRSTYATSISERIRPGGSSLQWAFCGISIPRKGVQRNGTGSR